MAVIGIIGGSGLYRIEGLTDAAEVRVDTPFGEPSDAFTVGTLEGKAVAFLPRHGRGHRIPPTDINYRANIYAMKKLGVSRIVSVTACGSLREDFRPLDFVLPDQFVDRTNQARKMSFFEKHIVAHISFADPVCTALRRDLRAAMEALGMPVHFGGTYVTMEGPAFSTRAESNLYRSWGMDLIGMTNMSEAKLAREAEICYATLAAVTDYDCWYESGEDVTVEMVIENLQKNAENAKKIIRQFVKDAAGAGPCGCASSLAHAIITDPDLIPQQVKQDLAPIIGKYIR